MKNQIKRQAGYSLLQLVIVLVMTLILLFAAYPGYRDSVLKVRRAEARSALLSTMLQQERFYTQHNIYSAFTSETGHSPFKWWSGNSAETSYYEISARPCPDKQLNQCVLLTATSNSPKVRHVDDPVCGDLMLDSANNKTYSNGTKPNSLCW